MEAGPALAGPRQPDYRNHTYHTKASHWRRTLMRLTMPLPLAWKPSAQCGTVLPDMGLLRFCGSRAAAQQARNPLHRWRQRQGDSLKRYQCRAPAHSPQLWNEAAWCHPTLLVSPHAVRRCGATCHCIGTDHGTSQVLPSKQTSRLALPTDAALKAGTIPNNRPGTTKTATALARGNSQKAEPNRACVCLESKGQIFLSSRGHVIAVQHSSSSTRSALPVLRVGT